MFCSKCGRTIPQGSSVCAHCGTQIAGSAFSAASYIASQPVLNQSASEAEAQPRYARYTRTTYTTMPEENADDVFRRTSYRPVYQEPARQEEEPSSREEQKKPESEQGSEKANSGAGKARQTSSADADLSALPEEMRPKPLQKVTLKGISPQMAERMRAQQEEEESAPAKKKPARPVVPSLFSSAGRGAKTVVPRREVPKQNPVEDEDSSPDEPQDEPYEEEEDKAFDVSDLEEEEDAQRAPLFSFRRQNNAPPSRSTVILRVVVVAVCVIALSVGGFVWLSLNTAAKSPISGVTYTLYEKGIALLEEHTTTSYRSTMANLYTSDMTGTSVLAKQQQDRADLTALLPGTQLVNDQDFLNTLLSIQDQIDIAVTLDAVSGDQLDQNASAERWRLIDNAINRLKNTTDAMELASIASGAQYTTTPAPSPSPTPSPYSTLYKGMNNDPDVKAMQERLYDLGWFNDTRDGDFGALTQTAVKQFQEACNISATGIADPETLAAIYAEDAPRTGAKITPAPAAGDGTDIGSPVITDAPAQPDIP